MNMRPIKILLFIVCITLSTCLFAQRTVNSIPTPNGFERHETDAYGAYLRNLPLKPQGTPVKYYDGTVKNYQEGAFAVIDMEIGNRDLQQCADAVMRLRGEYLWHNKLYDKIHFNFTSGFKAEYTKWAQGYRIKVSGDNVNWYKAKEQDYSYASFRKYMNIVFSYAGTASLSQELTPVNVNNLKIGDIFIIGGHPGHAMVIVDMAYDKSGTKAILVAQSYMPAQDIHIVTNLNDTDRSPWYIINPKTSAISFPEYYFTINQIMRFQ